MSFKKCTLVAFCWLAVLLTGCNVTEENTMATLPTGALPALLEASEQDELTTAMQALLFGRAISINKNAFTQKSTLSIERNAGVDAQGQPLNGRELMQPSIVFSLWMHGTDCWLQRDDTKDALRLGSVTCKAV